MKYQPRSFNIHYSKFTIQAQRPLRGLKMNAQPKPDALQEVVDYKSPIILQPLFLDLNSGEHGLGFANLVTCGNQSPLEVCYFFVSQFG